MSKENIFDPQEDIGSDEKKNTNDCGARNEKSIFERGQLFNFLIAFGYRGIQGRNDTGIFFVIGFRDDSTARSFALRAET